jgi:phage shock protein A
MASLLDKVGTLIQANLHALVDSALQSNSIAVIDQYIRDVGDNLDKLTDSTAVVGGQVKTLQRKRDEIAKQMQDIDRNIDLFLTQNKEELARAAQAQYNAQKTSLEAYNTQLASQEKEYEALKNARLKLQAKLTTIRQQRDQTAMMMELLKAKQITNKAIKSLDDLAGTGDTDVARIAQGIQSKLDSESARAEIAATNLDQQMDDTLGRGELDAQLEERKRRLGVS